MPASVFSSTTLVVTGCALGSAAWDGAPDAGAEAAGAAEADAVAEGARRGGSAREQPRPSATHETASSPSKAR